MSSRATAVFVAFVFAALPAGANAANGGTPAPSTSSKHNGGAWAGQFRAAKPRPKLPRAKVGPGLRVGSAGGRVRYLQNLLARLGYDVPITGRFGPVTAAAVKAVQRAAGLRPSGSVSTITLGAIRAERIAQQQTTLAATGWVFPLVPVSRVLD